MEAIYTAWLELSNSMKTLYKQAGFDLMGLQRMKASG
jgi:hypothetical protein